VKYGRALVYQAKTLGTMKVMRIPSKVSWGAIRNSVLEEM